ncbi:unnamed protein product [Adineta ricciae]|uniref:Uncharacterized protein n=1 Tax=Adineta ricciae TaxID=249248 RepID=A0A815M0B3_ADIRI|nr:unnamed protein product [Adineta ricciae]
MYFFILSIPSSDSKKTISCEDGADETCSRTIHTNTYAAHNNNSTDWNNTGFPGTCDHYGGCLDLDAHVVIQGTCTYF